MTRLAITGLDVQLANIDNIDQFERALYLAKPIISPAFAERNPSVLMAQSLGRIKAQHAASDSQCAVFILGDKNLEQAEHYYQCQNFTQLSDILAVAAQLPEGITAIIVAASLAGEVTSPNDEVLATLSFSNNFNQYHSNEAVVAICLTKATPALEQSDKPYGFIEAVSTAKSPAEAAYQTLATASLSANHIEQLEANAACDKSAALSEGQGLVTAYQSSSPLTIAISSVKSIVGDCGHAAALMSLLKSILCVQQRYIAATHDWAGPSDDFWHSSPFYFAGSSRTWYLGKGCQQRYCALSITEPQQAAHIIVADNPNDTARDNGYFANSDLVLIPLTANKQGALLKQLDTLEADINDCTALNGLALEYYHRFMQKPAKLSAALLAESKDELLKEIQLARLGIARACKEKSEWKTPKGSYFSAKPLGDGENVAFLYPGIGAAYIGLGKDLLHLFPQVFSQISDLVEDLSASVKARTLYPRAVDSLGFKELKQLDSMLRNHLSEIAECGVTYACIFTFIFENVFKVRADFSTGYSMGEISMYAALGCWQDPAQMSERLAGSDTFNHRLSGELRALRQHWDLPEAKTGFIEKLWETYSLKATAEQVQEACEEEDRVYCTIINTPDSLVIGGYPEACQRVIKRLGVRAMALDMANAIHSPPAFKEYEHMEKLYTMDVTERIKTKMYSSSCYLPVPQRSKSIANSISKCLCDPVDFPRLIRTMHGKGANIFIEMGPGRSLSSWVEKILKEDQQHVSLPVNAKGTSDELTFVRAMAKLLSHGSSIDISCLYEGTLLKSNA